jgi:hypothetical protein
MPTTCWNSIPPKETNIASSASFLDLYLEFDDSVQISTKIYDKQDDFNFKIINFPNMCSNIPVSPAYGVYILQLIRYARASSNYSEFANLELLIDKTSSIYLYVKLKALASWIFLSFTSFWGNSDSYAYKNKSENQHKKCGGVMPVNVH